MAAGSVAAPLRGEGVTAAPVAASPRQGEGETACCGHGLLAAGRGRDAGARGVSAAARGRDGDGVFLSCSAAGVGHHGGGSDAGRGTDGGGVHSGSGADGGFDGRTGMTGQYGGGSEAVTASSGAFPGGSSSMFPFPPQSGSWWEADNDPISPAFRGPSPWHPYRDLKAENILLGADGAWKLCDFGSVSTNHKCFDKPEEMGIEEDNIRKHTTPAYRAPEMWDLYRREVLSEKVDIWALGCLLFRICYFKSAFDGESKLQILNGNYRIPELPKYSSSVTSLIQDMLNSSPDIRPDITQVWFRVNELLPLELQKDLPDGSPSGSAFESHTAMDEALRTMPQRSSPSLSRENTRTTFDSSNQRSQGLPNAMENKGSMGAFWSTQHAQELAFVDDKWSAFDKEQATSKQAQDKNQSTPAHTTYRKSLSASVDTSPGDYEIRFSPNGSEYGLEKTKTARIENKTTTQTTAFNSFVAHFDDVNVNMQNNVNSISMTSKLKEQQLEAEVILLKEQLKIANLEKEEISLKFDRLSSICSSQRQEIQELKKTLATASATPSVKELREHSKVELSSPSANLATPPREKIEGTPPELRQGLFKSTSPGTPSPDSKPGSAFPEPEESKFQGAVKSAHPRSVRTLRASNSTKANSLGQSKTRIGADPFAFGQDSFKADPSGTALPKISKLGNTSQPLVGNLNSKEKNDDSYQPAGWTGF